MTEVVRGHARHPLGIWPRPFPSQYFMTSTDVTQVNLSHHGRHKGRQHGRRTERVVAALGVAAQPAARQERRPAPVAR
eukprot:COSAG01_NODE_3924_length_5529_cov_1.581584_7_plen_77_part_01